MRIIILLLLIYTTACANEDSNEQKSTWDKVKYVIDGDTFVTTKGITVRLLGINTPETGHGTRPAELMGEAASKFAKNLLNGQKVELKIGERKYDKYKRLLAQVYLTDGTWVNKALLEAGYAHVYTFPDNRAGTKKLLEAENTARQNNRGLWALPRWKMRHTNSCCANTDAGKFILVTGTVNKVATRKGITYLNFGENWRTDFTVEIKKKYAKNFMANPAKFYGNKTLIIHGRVKPVNGWLISTSHPEQIEIIK